MKTSEEIDIKIFEYLDGVMQGHEREVFEQTLLKDEVIKNRLTQLKQVNDLLKTDKVFHPSKNFTQQVMGNLYTKPLTNDTTSIRNSLFLLFGMIVVIGLCAVLLSKGFFNDSTTIDVNQIGVINKYANRVTDQNLSLPSFNMNGNTMINVIIFLNLALALIVLDKGVLKPLFQRRLNES